MTADHLFLAVPVLSFAAGLFFGAYIQRITDRRGRR